MPSVTTVLGLLSNYDFVSKDIMDRAARFGSAVHKIVELHENGKLDEASLRPREKYLADMTPILEAWKRCKVENNIQVLEAEKVVVSMKWQYAGRLDVIALVKGVPAIVEIKSRPYNPMLDNLQTAAYSGGYCENHPKFKIKERFLCELKLDGDFNMTRISTKQDGDLSIFRCCLAAFNYRNRWS